MRRRLPAEMQASRKKAEPVVTLRRNYVLIWPCRNEARHFRQTLDTVIAQSERPALWVIVDDGSSDETPNC